MPVHVRYNRTMSIDTTVRAEYRKRIQQRQTVIFGTISAILATLLLLGILFWTGLVPFPFDREFSVKEDAAAAPAPCPSEGITAVPLEQITARVYNSTSRTGLAGDVGDKLAATGVVVADKANWNGDKVSDAAMLVTGPAGVDAAYTLRAYIPNAIIQLDPASESNVVDVVLGTAWEDVVSAPTEEELANALKPIKNCQNPE